jgi:DNA (cytosine-5)-methyltransferase 1
MIANDTVKTVRRLTPLECERLMGLPDGYTGIEYKGKPAPDSKRYKALGNGMAQPCADWVIKRIAEVCSQGIVKEHEFSQG